MSSLWLCGGHKYGLAVVMDGAISATGGESERMFWSVEYNRMTTKGLGIELAPEWVWRARWRFLHVGIRSTGRDMDVIEGAHDAVSYTQSPRPTTGRGRRRLRFG